MSYAIIFDNNRSFQVFGNCIFLSINTKQKQQFSNKTVCNFSKKAVDNTIYSHKKALK